MIKAILVHVYLMEPEAVDLYHAPSNTILPYSQAGHCLGLH